MRYTLTWRNKYLATQARSIGDMAQALEDAARQLRGMEQDGVILDLDSGVEDDHALLVTTDPEVARRHDFEEDDPEAEEAGAPAPCTDSVVTNAAQ